MNATKKLYDTGQSLWLDNITRDILTNGDRFVVQADLPGVEAKDIEVILR